MKRLLLSGLFLLSVVAAYARPRPVDDLSSPAQLKLEPSEIQQRSSLSNDTIYFGGTRWAPDSMRWEAIKDSVWTFDSGVGSFIKEPGKTYPNVDPYKPDGFHGGMEGWTGWDLTYKPVTFFRRLSSSDPRWRGSPCVGAAAGFEGMYSFWVGAFSAEAESLCYATGKGYGNQWDVCIEHTFDYAGGQVALSFTYKAELETGYDFAHVECDTGGSTPVEVVSYTGSVSGVATQTLIQGVDLPRIPRPIKLRFCVNTDGAWSDQDGLNPTDCGAFAVDNLVINGGIIHSADFESSDDGWELSTPPPGLGGDWSNLAAVSELPPIGDNLITQCTLRDSVLVFFHPVSRQHPYFQENLAISPWVDLERFGVEGQDGYAAILDGYFDLPLRNYVFVEAMVQWFPDSCIASGGVRTSEWTSNGFYYYYGNNPVCGSGNYRRAIDFDDVIPPGVKRLRVAVGIANLCHFYLCEDGSNGLNNSTPWFDNLQFATYTIRTIQDAIDLASSGDTVWVPPGMYAGPGNVELTFRGKNIVLKSTAGAQSTIIDGQEEDRGIVCDVGDSATVVGITFRKCAAPKDVQGSYLNGGAVYIGSGATMRFEDCLFTQCTAAYGGGIYLARDAWQYFLRCMFVGNLRGGGAWSESPSTTSAIHCEFDSNATGGASLQGAAHVEDCVFSGNKGGGLHEGESGSVIGCRFLNNKGIGLSFGACGQFSCFSSVHVRNCTISGNNGADSGGGVNGYGGDIDSCLVTGNSATFAGGGVALHRTSCHRTIIENNEVEFWGGGVEIIGGLLDSCLIRGNWSGAGGGGVVASTELGFNLRAPVTISNCLISGNKTYGSGGGVYFYETSDKAPGCLTSTTVSANKAQRGGGVYCRMAFSADRSIFWGNAADSSGAEVFLVDPDTMSVFICSAIDSFGVAGDGHAVYEGPQVFMDPLFCGAAIASNAPTSDGDYTLAFDSPCLPGKSPCDSLIGALGQGCDVVSVLPPPDPEEPPFLKTPGIHAGPNPFSQTLTIHYLSPIGTDPRLEIYSVDGRLIGKWALRPGSGVVDWDGRDPIGKPVASGIYLVRYIAGDLHIVRRVVRLTR